MWAPAVSGFTTAHTTGRDELGVHGVSEVDTVEDVERLGRSGLLVRTLAVVLVLVATLGGTFVGQDADFPFGPFRMYATRSAPDGAVNSLRLEAVDTTGNRFVVSAGSVGLRRAEFEGSLPELRTQPPLLASVATRWEANHPDSPQLVRLEIIIRKTQLKNGLETNEVTDTVVATWVRR